MNKIIGVIGCGWLGLPLAKNLLRVGYKVKGTTTSPQKMSDLANAGIEPFCVKISEKGIDGDIPGFLKDTETLIINIPPRLRGKGPKENYIRKIELLLNALESFSVSKVLFVSSTSVFGDGQGEVNEETLPLPTSESGKQLLATEKMIRENPKFDASIIRFSGLIGPDRHPVTMLSGRTNLNGGNAPVNLIHLDDCIGIITSLVRNNYWGEIIHGVYPKHPTKASYYTQKALEKGLKPPIYAANNTVKAKKITSCNLFLIKEYKYLTSI